MLIAVPVSAAGSAQSSNCQGRTARSRLSHLDPLGRRAVALPTVGSYEGRQVQLLGGHWRRARNGTEMARAVRMTLCRAWPPVAPARAMGEARPGRHQQHRWQAAEGGTRRAAASRGGCSSTADGQRKKQGVTRSLPLLIYSAPGGLRQDPGRVAQSPAEARTCGNRDSRSTCAVVDVWASLNVEPTVGLAVRCGHSARRCGVRAAGLRSSWPKCNLVERGFHD